jgi:starch phosphorylase
LLERHVVPLFYDRNEDNVPVGWVQKMKHALRVSGSFFTARRMLQEYVTKYYVPAVLGDSTADDPPTA